MLVDAVSRVVGSGAMQPGVDKTVAVGVIATVFG